MKVFISWSGDHSKEVAFLLRDWLPLVIQAIKPWVSSADIEKGESWFSSIQGSLADSKGMGVFCLTRANLAAPWLAFEAGALSAHDRGRVATLLHGLDANEVRPPLSLFQATQAAEKNDVLALLKSINARLPDPLDLALLQRTFEANWNHFSEQLKAISIENNHEKKRQGSPDEVLNEILATVRRLERDAENSKKVITETFSEKLKKYQKRPSEYTLRDFLLDKSEEERQQIEEAIKDDPLVARMIQDWGAKVVPNSIRLVDPDTTGGKD